MPGFQPHRVVRIVVHLTGFGSVDDLTASFPDLAPASVRVRNGSGANPTILSTTSMPVLGRGWSAELDCTAFADGLAVLVVRGSATTGWPSAFGEVLVGGGLLGRSCVAYSGAKAQFTWSIPYDMSLCGLEVHVQGLCKCSSSRWPRSWRLRGGLSNALDLVLGL